VVLVIFVLFGAGKLPRAMGDLGKAIRYFRAGLKGEDMSTNIKEQILPERDQEESSQK
jgi:sec-independent protein translocase protein TatA